MKESILDIPRKTLDQDIFELSAGTWKLLPRVRQEILAKAEEYSQWGELIRVLLIGSILTRYWKSTSDVDVTLLLKPKSTEAFDLARHEAFETQNTQLLLDTEHPLNFYVRNDLIKNGWENIYDVTGNGWIRKSEEPTISSPEEYLQQFDKLIRDIDIGKGELARDLVDYHELSELGANDVDNLHVLVANKVSEIDGEVKKLVVLKRTVQSLRKSAFEKPLSADELEKYKTKNLLPISVLYKVLERYHYLKLLKELEKVLNASGGQIATKKDVKGIEKALGIGNVVEELISELTTSAAAGSYDVPLGMRPQGRLRKQLKKRKLLMPGHRFLYGVTA